MVSKVILFKKRARAQLNSAFVKSSLCLFSIAFSAFYLLAVYMDAGTLANVHENRSINHQNHSEPLFATKFDSFSRFLNEPSTPFNFYLLFIAIVAIVVNEIIKFLGRQ